MVPNGNWTNARNNNDYYSASASVRVLVHRTNPNETASDVATWTRCACACVCVGLCCAMLSDDDGDDNEKNNNSPTVI